MELILQQSANGITIGMGYALVAVGLTLIFGVLHVINFSHGEFYMLGGYGIYVSTQVLGFSYLVGSILTVVLVTLIGWLVEKVSIRPVIKRDNLNALLTTFAISLFFINLMQGIFTATAKPVLSPYNEMIVHFGNIYTTVQKVGIIIVGILILLLMNLFLKRSVWGKMMRATAQNQFAAEIVGIEIRKIYSFSFALGAGLASLSGVLIVPTTGIFPLAGQLVLLKAFIVVILGGLGNIYGAVFGGLFLGLAETIGASFLNTAWSGIVGYVLLILTLLIRPSGLFGKRGSVKH